MGLQIVSPNGETQGDTTPSNNDLVVNTDEINQKEITEVKDDEKETPSETSTEEKPVEELTLEPEVVEEKIQDDTKAITGITSEKQKLLDEIIELRRERRELRTPKSEMVVEQPKEPEVDLSDVDPETKEMVEKVIKAGGYVRKSDVEKLTYSNVKQEALDGFLEKHPDLKVENDPNDLNWTRFNSTLGLFKQPGATHKSFNQVLENAYKLAFPTNSKSIEDLKSKREVLNTASLGTTKKSSPGTTPSSANDIRLAEMYRRGGFSDEDTQEMLKDLKKE